MIVTSRPPRKRPKPAQPVEIKAPGVVRTTPKGRAWRLKELEPDRSRRRCTGCRFLRPHDPSKR